MARRCRRWRRRAYGGFHKKRGLVTSDRDPDGRPTVFSALPADLPRVISVGRLDIDSEGLLLLTNDGGLARHLELPATGWLRKYRVRVHGRVDPARLAGLAGGIEIDGVRYGAVQASLDSQAASNAWLTIGLREGKNREIRRLMDHLGYRVNRLIRTSYGPFALGHLAAGAVDEVRRRVLREQLGLVVNDGGVRRKSKKSWRRRAANHRSNGPAPVRIVAGRHRGARLRAPAGRDIRPTADRTREALFNLLANGRHGRPLGRPGGDRRLRRDRRPWLGSLVARRRPSAVLGK